MLTAAERAQIAQTAGIRLPLPVVPDLGVSAAAPTFPQLSDPTNPPPDAEPLPPSWAREMFDQYRASKKQVGAAAASAHNTRLWSMINTHRMRWNAALKKRNPQVAASPVLTIDSLIAALSSASSDERAAFLAALEVES